MVWKSSTARPKSLKGEVVTTQLDVTNESAVVLFMNKTSEKFGGVNVLVNNAAILRDGPLAKKEGGWTRKLPTAVWKQVLEVNLTAPYFLAREMVADALQRQQQTRLIVNISSLSRAGNPHQSNYSASKAGLDACTRTWAWSSHSLAFASRALRRAWSIRRCWASFQKKPGTR